MGRFDNITVSPTTGRFDTLQTKGGRFDNIKISKQSPAVDVFKKTTKGFGGLIGTVGRILTAPQQATTGLIEKGLEKAGILKPKTPGLGLKAGIEEQKSNIETLRRVGEETGKGGVLTGQYTASTSVLGNFVKELPVTIIGMAGDLFLDPLVLASKIGLVAKSTGTVGKAVGSGLKTAQRQVPAVQKISDIIGNLSVNRYGQREAFKNLDIARKIGESAVKEKTTILISDVIEKPAIIQQTRT